MFNPFHCITTWCQRRHELALRRLELHEAVEKAKAEAIIKRAESAVPGDAWEELTLLQGGWKDEYITVLFSVMMVMAFIPFTQPFVIGAFAAMSTAPLWFQISSLTIIGSALGVRLFSNLNEVFKK